MRMVPYMIACACGWCLAERFMSPTAPPRTLKVFLASPGDVTEERAALARLVRDINDVLTFLVPDKRLNLELVRYET
jgi:hypothetical protein